MDDLMKEAHALTNGDRRAAYGNPREVFGAYGLAWSAILARKLKPGENVTAEDVTLMMTALKLLRESNKVGRDNVVDAHGYLALHARIAGLVEELPHAPTEAEWQDLGRPPDVTVIVNGHKQELFGLATPCAVRDVVERVLPPMSAGVVVHPADYYEVLTLDGHVMSPHHVVNAGDVLYINARAGIGG